MLFLYYMKVVGECVRMSPPCLELFRRIHRWFFLNRSEDAELILLVDFGRVKYPQYFDSSGSPVQFKAEDNAQTNSEVYF